jgi:small subunit ribosomal protein S9
LTETTEIPTEAFVTGKRKTAIARVRMRLGTGQILVNGRPANEYFPRDALIGLVNEPIEVASVGGRYDVIATVKGGGVSGQAGALRHGIARAIEKLDPSQRIALKRSGLLTRDARKKERKKYGQRGARARFQFSKR